MTPPDRLSLLRQQMAGLKLDAFLVPRGDEFQNEYVPASAERLAWLTGFTGSAGTAIIALAKAALLVDGRYTLQAPQETDPAHYTILNSTRTTPLDWMLAELADGSRIGFDPRLHQQDWIETAGRKLTPRKMTLVPVTSNPLDACWPDRPSEPTAPFFAQPVEFSGESSSSKCQRMAAELKKAGVQAFVLTRPECVAWLLNIRGNDIPHTPFPLAYAILHNTGALDLFAGPGRVDDVLRAQLGNQVTIHLPEKLPAALQALAATGQLAADPTHASAWIYSTAGHELRPLADPCILPKACKNATELAGARAAHRRDGVALIRLLASLRAGDDELGLMARLRQFRAEGEHFRDLSFETIAGSGPHGAIVHYRASAASNRPLQDGELLLLDSGGQYADGTTDITRTVAIGRPSPEMRDRFTRVLKGHIAIAMARFPKGTTGSQLDPLSRQALWAVGLDFGHRTGHGVGSYLSVHEGPVYLGARDTVVPLAPGMILSNEPGYYKAGHYGIRIESLVAVREASLPGAEQETLEFETLSLCPVDRALIEPGLLIPAERDWLNQYHQRVWHELSGQLDTATRTWLEAACQPV